MLALPQKEITPIDPQTIGCQTDQRVEFGPQRDRQALDRAGMITMRPTLWFIDDG